MSETKQQKKLKIALVCDWLTTPGGAEKVLLELHRMYPDAPIYTSQYKKKQIDWFDDADVRTGWLQIFPAKFRRIIGPLRQRYFEHLDLSDYDLVISVTGAEAKAVRTRKGKDINEKTPEGAYHICYCHVPTQYYWQLYGRYIYNPGFGILNPLVRVIFRAVSKPMRAADYEAAQRPDKFVTISNYSKEQIKHFYDRDAEIVAPPVAVKKFRPRKGFSTDLSTENTIDLHKISPVNPQEAEQYYTEKRKKSTVIPQDDADLSTKNGELSTESVSKNKKSSVATVSKGAKSAKNNSFPQVDNAESTFFPQVNDELSTKATTLSTGDTILVHNLYRESPDKIAGFDMERTELQDRFPRYYYSDGAKYPRISYGVPRQYYVIACRQVNWKRVDLAIKACLRARRSLLIVGDGPENRKLRKLVGASRRIRFVRWSSPEELAAYLHGAKGFIMPSLEPFGIAAVEALAAGCPVLALEDGGSSDYIIEGVNGTTFEAQITKTLAKAIRKFEMTEYDRAKVSATADKFAPKYFRQGIEKVVAEATKEKSGKVAKTHRAEQPVKTDQAEKTTEELSK